MFFKYSDQLWYHLICKKAMFWRCLKLLSGQLDHRPFHSLVRWLFRSLVGKTTRPFRDGKTSRTEVAISGWSEIVCFFQHESLIFGFREKKTGTPSQFDGKKHGFRWCSLEPIRWMKPETRSCTILGQATEPGQFLSSICLKIRKPSAAKGFVFVS